jgi:uroporphyrinogen-III synthase
MSIVPITDEQQQAIKNHILALDNYHKVIFVSQNAVQHGMEWIERYWPQLPYAINFYAIGATTAKLLSQYGVRVEDLALSEQSDMTSESLLKAPSLQHITEQKILIMRGCGGRGELAQQLSARGASVQYCELYKRELPADAQQQWQDFLQQHSAQARCIITVHSGETLQQLSQILEATDAAIQVQQNWPLLVPSTRIAQHARTQGWQQVVCAKNATDAAMTQALTDFLAAQQTQQAQQ